MPDFLPWSADLPRQAGTKLLAILAGAPWERWTREFLSTLDDAGVAEAAKDFALVRVDADRRPDVARRVAPSGDPTLALLTPDGFPLAATAWAPPRSIREFLSAAAFQWKIRAPLVAAEAKKAREAALDLSRLRPKPGPVDAEFVRACVEALAETCDPVHGGWGVPPRGLHVAALRLLAERTDLPEGASALERTLRGMQEAADAGAFSHSWESSDWSSPDGMVFPDEAAELAWVFATAGRTLNNGTFSATAHLAEGWSVARLHAGSPAAPPGDSLTVVARDSTQASLRAVSTRSMETFARDLVARRTDSASGLLRRTDAPDDVFHLADQAEALRVLARLDPARAATLAAAVRAHFWDAGASAFRDRHGPTVELAPLDMPQFPIEENAVAAAAFARLGGEWLSIAKTCLSSFTDACYGQGVQAARLALAVHEVLRASEVR
ncbi:MAG: hypothetical protein IT452_19110 [Planctomycetia bacterium]|nr:hypothetical protein [Planctomycetia bacterium]